VRFTSLEPIAGAGGYTPARRMVGTLEDGTTVFVKEAVDDLTRWWLRSERWSYESLGPQSFLPRYLGGEGDQLVLEDLRGAHWPPPWRAGDVERVLATLVEVAETAPPAEALDLETVAGEMLRSWSKVAAAPDELLALGVCSRSWLDDALPVLLEAEAAGTLAGDSLVHFDVRSDNLCLTADGRVLLVDWNMTSRGRSDVDRVAFLQTVTVEGGREPPDEDPSLVAMITSTFAWNAGQPLIPNAPRVRAVQLAQLRVCLPWAARLLGLRPPDRAS
jgi:hypothetical protein